MPDQPAKKTKRRVKNPETFRERALKAGESTGKSKRYRLPRVPGKALRPLRPLAKPLKPVGKVVLPVYLRRSWQELRLVTWPSWSESRRLTVAVLIFAIVFGAAAAVVDYGLNKAFKELLLK